MAVSYTVSSAKLPIVPDLSGFHRKIKQQLRAEPAQAPVTVVPDFDKFAQKLETGLRRFNARIGVQVFPDLTGFGSRMRAQLRADRSELQVPLELDLTQARAQMAAFRAEVAAQPISARLDIDTTNALAQLAAVRTAARGIADLVGPNGAASRAAGQAAQTLSGGAVRRVRMQLEIDRSSVASAQAEVEAVAARIASARQKEQEAADRVTLAERRLSEVRRRASADSSQLLSAQQSLARAQRDYADSNARTAGLIGNQADAHRRLSQAQRDNGNTSRLIGAALGGIAETANNLGNRLTSVISPASAATVALVGLAAVNLVPLVGQLAQAAGVISLLPAGAAAAAASLATIVIGSTGVFDAFSAGSKASEDASKDAAAASKAQASAAKQVDSAQRGVANAVKQVEKAEDGVIRAERGVQQAQKQSQRAQEDLTQARKDAAEQIEDLNLSLKGSSLDERDAELSLRRAQQRLAELGKDGQPVTMLDYEEAVLGVDQAKQRIDEVRERNADLREEADAANKAGVDGSARVVAAQEAVADADLRVVDSKQAVVDAQEAVADAQAGVADAQANLAEAQANAATATAAGATAADKYAAALANLSPNARAFVEDVRSLGDEWRDLRLVLQDNLFAGLGTSITDLANNYFPVMKDGLGGIATEINGGLRRSLEDLGSEASQLDWTKILDNTKQAIGPLMDGLNDLWGSLTNIAAIGSEFLPGFGDSFSNVMQEFREFTESESGQNKIREFMRDSIEALKDILDLFGAIGRVIGGLFSTSEKTGKSMIEGMTDSLNEFADWLNSEDGKLRMAQFWEDAKSVITDLLKLAGMAIELAGVVTNSSSSAPNPDGSAPTSDNRSFERRFVDGADSYIAPGVTQTQDSKFFGDQYEKDGQSVDRYGNPIKYQAGIFPGVAEGSVGDSVLSGFGKLEDFFAGGAWSFLNPAEGESPFAAAMRQAGDGLAGVKQKAAELAGGFVADLATTAVGAWQSLQDKVTAVTTTIGGLIDVGKAKVSDFKDRVGEWLGNISGFWSNLGTSISTVVTNLTDVVFAKLTGALDSVKGFFGTVVDGIGKKWDELKDLAARPINWIIDTVINGTLKNAWNAVAAVIPGLSTWDGVARIETPEAGKGAGVTPKFATGGIIPGYTPGRDPYTIGVSGGEAVMRPEWTRAVGSDYVNQANQVARREGVAGLKKRLGYFANGGIVDSMASAVQEKFPGMSLTSGLRFTDNGYHSKGMAADFSDGTSSTPTMRQLAGWIADNFANRTIELIHDPFDRNIGAGSMVGDGYGFYGAGTMSEHNNHVHWAVDGPVGPGGAPGSPDGGGIIGAAGRAASGVVNSARRVAASLFDKAVSLIGSTIPDFGSSLIGQLPKAVFNAMKDKMVALVRGKSTTGGSTDSGSTDFDISAGVEQWRPNVIEALKREGFAADDRNVNLTLAQMQTESGGNPNIVQGVQDVNSGGNEAVGLMQVIPGTFATYRNPDLPNDRTNPDASLSAALRYYRARYGEDLGSYWGQGHGYANGGVIPGYTPGKDMFRVGVSGGESIMRPEWTRAMGPDYVHTMNKLARLRGAVGVREAMFANGGIVDPNEYARKRFAQYGEQVGGIVKSAIPEILGISGTPLDPASNRYVQAAMDLQKSFASAQPAVGASYGPATAPSSPVGVGPAGGDATPITIVVQSVDDAFRQAQLMQQKQALTYVR